MTKLESLRQLDDLLAECGNGHDRVDTLIAEAIRMGVDTEPAIVVALETIGRKPAHVRIRLGTNAKLHPDRRPWFRDADGRLHIQS